MNSDWNLIDNEVVSGFQAGVEKPENFFKRFFYFKIPRPRKRFPIKTKAARNGALNGVT